MKRILSLLLALFLVGSLAACQTPPVDPVESGDASDTDAPVSADTDETTEAPAPAVDPAEVEDFAILKTDGTLTVQSVTVPAENFRILSPRSAVMMDETHLLVLLWDESDTGEVEDLRFTFVDLETGKFTEPAHSLDGTLVPDNAYRGIDGELYLQAYGREDDDDIAWRITGQWYEPTVETLTAKEAQDLSWNHYTSVTESGDGMWIAWHRNSYDNRALSGLWMRDAAGGVKQLKKNVSLDDVPADYEGQAIGAVRSYYPIGFIDDVTLVYGIGGWEWTCGYGYYDTVTHEIREVENGRRVLAIGDGFLYTADGGSYSYDTVYKEYPDGTEEVLISEETNENEAFAPFFLTDMLVGLNYTDRLCAILYPVDTSYPASTDALQLTVFDADLSAVRLSAYVKPDNSGYPFWTWCGDTLVIFRAGGAE